MLLVPSSKLELCGVVRRRRGSGVAYPRVRPLPCRTTRTRTRTGGGGGGSGRRFPRLHRRCGLDTLRRLQSALHRTRGKGTSSAGWYRYRCRVLTTDAPTQPVHGDRNFLSQLPTAPSVSIKLFSVVPRPAAPTQNPSPVPTRLVGGARTRLPTHLHAARDRSLLIVQLQPPNTPFPSPHTFIRTPC